MSERGPGRPPLGHERVSVYLPPDLVMRLDAEAATRASSRSALIRDLLTERLDALESARPQLPDFAEIV